MKPLVLVTWIDAADHGDTWVDTEDAEKFGDLDCKVVSVGFLIRKTDKYITIGSDWDEADSNYGTVRKLPVGMIVSIQEVAHPDKLPTESK